MRRAPPRCREPAAEGQNRPGAPPPPLSPRARSPPRRSARARPPTPVAARRASVPRPWPSLPPGVEPVPVGAGLVEPLVRELLFERVPPVLLVLHLGADVEAGAPPSDPRRRTPLGRRAAAAAAAAAAACAGLRAAPECRAASSGSQPPTARSRSRTAAARPSRSGPALAGPRPVRLSISTVSS